MENRCCMVIRKRLICSHERKGDKIDQSHSFCHLKPYGKSKYIKFKYLYFSNLFNYFCSHIRDVQMVFNLWEDAMNF
ncbi:hypothetical protein Q604_UNBC08592G0004 [human gut metagenome]|uniref:Uncharacterized protein n=1 Tax=human gut metagenome TaxID=408170 RepID=W1Y3Q5_9ZZZZ